MTKEITGLENEVNDFRNGVQDAPDADEYIRENLPRVLSKAIASAVEAERAKWVFASEDVRKTMTERFLQDKQNEQINPSKE